MIEQVCIAVTELIAIWLIHDKRDHYSKFASILRTPFWFYASYTADQWGSFFLCFFFTAAWLKSLNEYWIKDKPPLTNKQYYDLIVDAVEKATAEKKTTLDYKDYISRVLKEALNVK